MNQSIETKFQEVELPLPLPLLYPLTQAVEQLSQNLDISYNELYVRAMSSCLVNYLTSPLPYDSFFTQNLNLNTIQSILQPADTQGDMQNGNKPVKIDRGISSLNGPNSETVILEEDDDDDWLEGIDPVHLSNEEDTKKEIKHYEKCFEMTSEEFLEKYSQNQLPDTYEYGYWLHLLSRHKSWNLKMFAYL